jgi:hypothetical protein
MPVRHRGSDVWIPRIGPKAVRERQLGNRIIFVGLLLGLGLVLLVLLKVSHVLPPALIQSGEIYIVVFGAHGVLMAPCVWLPMYFLAGRSCAARLVRPGSGRRRWCGAMPLVRPVRDPPPYWSGLD